jgi:branched-chain amino acid transport system substrate-binding protein
MFKTTLITALAVLSLHAAGQTQEPIKVGMLNIDGGAFAVTGPIMNDAAAFAIDALNAQGGALGRKYQLVTQMHSGTPAAAMAGASKLVDQQGVAFFAALNGSATALAIASRLPTMNALFIDTTAATDDLTGKNCQPNYFRIGVNDSMMMNALRPVVKQSGAKTWNALMVDYSAGHDYAKNITALIQEQGGSMGTTLFAPVGATDFGSYISQLNAAPADGLVIFMPGSGGIAFAKQQQQYGLFAKYKTVIAHSSFTNETFVDAQGDTTAGTLTTQSYLADMPGALNAAFVKAYEGRYKRKPSYYDADVYLSYSLLNAAIVKAGSTDVAAVRAALAGLKANTIVGDVEMRAADHQLLRPMVVVQVVKTREGNAEIALRAVEPASKVTPAVSPECKMGT